jgi:hypothetical protein
MGIRDKPIAPGSPWQNAFAKRLIGSIRREFIDHVVVLGEANLRRILQSYARYYNTVRTHRSLNKDAPVSRPVQRIGLSFPKIPSGADSLDEGESEHHSTRCLPSSICLEHLSPTCSSRGAGLKSRTSSFAISSILL